MLYGYRKRSFFLVTKPRRRELAEGLGYISQMIAVRILLDKSEWLKQLLKLFWSYSNQASDVRDCRYFGCMGDEGERQNNVLVVCRYTQPFHFKDFGGYVWESIQESYYALATFQ